MRSAYQVTAWNHRCYCVPTGLCKQPPCRMAHVLPVSPVMSSVEPSGAASLQARSRARSSCYHVRCGGIPTPGPCTVLGQGISVGSDNLFFSPCKEMTAAPSASLSLAWKRKKTHPRAQLSPSPTPHPGRGVGLQKRFIIVRDAFRFN